MADYIALSAKVYTEIQRRLPKHSASDNSSEERTNGGCGNSPRRRSRSSIGGMKSAIRASDFASAGREKEKKRRKEKKIRGGQSRKVNRRYYTAVNHDCVSVG